MPAARSPRCSSRRATRSRSARCWPGSNGTASRADKKPKPNGRRLSGAEAPAEPNRSTDAPTPSNSRSTAAAVAQSAAGRRQRPQRRPPDGPRSGDAGLGAGRPGHPPAGPQARRRSRPRRAAPAPAAGSPRTTSSPSRSSPAAGRRRGGARAPRRRCPTSRKWGPIEDRPLDADPPQDGRADGLAWSQVPHVTQHDLADVTDLEAFRKPQSTATGPKLTVTAFVLKAAAVALKEFPHFNSSLDIAGGRLILKGYYHIGVAVDTDRGLLVPVVRDVDKKSVRELAAEVADLAEKARQRKLPIDDMKGGTFTITNLGGIGGTAFTPIVNWPEVAILGLSRARLEPVVRDGQVVPRLMLPLSLSYDHRVIDGADGARFTRRIAEMLEDPMLLLLDA